MLNVNNLSLSFTKDNKELPILKDVSLTIENGEFFVLLGQSGCGKTTLLRCLGGFLKPLSGSVSLDGHPVTQPSRESMMVFQSFDQLFPWFTLKENIVYALKKSGVPSNESEEKALKFLSLTGLAGFENQYPASLSGGMKQRGAIARALALEPSILLMDEPFSSLDYLTRQSIQALVKDLTKKTGCTVLLVTHDIDEALLLGDRIGILDKKTKKISSVYSASGCNKEELRSKLIKELV